MTFGSDVEVGTYSSSQGRKVLSQQTTIVMTTAVLLQCLDQFEGKKELKINQIFF